MPEPQTGNKPAENKQPDVMPTQEPTGTKKEQSVMPTDAAPIIDEDPTIEKDGQKVVPFDSYKAEKEKRQDIEARLRQFEEQQAKPKEPEKPQEPDEETPAIDWDSLLGLTGNQPQQPDQSKPTEHKPQPTAPPSQVSPDWLRNFNEELREMRENGDELGAIYRAGMFFQAQQDAMRNAAKKVVKDFDTLPLHTVDSTELQFFQQNPEALRAVLAKIKSGKSVSLPTASQKPSNDNNNAPPANWQELQEKLRQEGREEAMKALTAQSGISGEGTRADTAPSGEAFELDEEGKNYMRKRGIPEDKWPLYAKQLHHELEGRF
jgi:hypothetical protein